MNRNRILPHIKKLAFVLLLVLAIIAGCLWVNDHVYFSGKDVDGIYVEEDVRIVTERNWGINYCKLLKKAIKGSKEDIKKLILLDFSGSGAVGYDHGDVVVKLINRLGEETIISSLGEQLSIEEKSGIKADIDVGLEYGSNPYQGQKLEKTFPLLYQYLQQ